MHDYYRRKFRSLTEKYGQNDQRKVLALIQARANSLLNLKIENLANLTMGKKNEEITAKYESLFNLMDQRNSEFGQNNHLSGRLKRQVKLTNPETKICSDVGRGLKTGKRQLFIAARVAELRVKINAET